MKPISLNLSLLIICWLLSGCTTITGPADPNDPLESYNRSVYKFNDTLDTYILKPVAKGYDVITPDPAQQGISNFFSNLDDVVVMFNDLLQLKILQFASDTGRFLINSTLGIGGLFDWASDMGLPKHEEDFGQTLGYWGVPEGPYFMIPFIGPSTLRDAPSIFVDSSQFDPIWQELENGYPLNHRERNISWSLTAVDIIDTRATLLQAEKILDEAATDRYAFIREFYLQRRKNLVYDGNPPVEKAEFDESELFELDDEPKSQEGLNEPQ